MKVYPGSIVLFRGDSHNGTRVHPAIVNRVWGAGPGCDLLNGPVTCNLTVIPDSHAPYSVGSVTVFQDDTGQPRTAWCDLESTVNWTE